MSLPFGIQPGEALIILLVIILLIFGPTKLPQLARAIGRSIYEFKKASEGLLEEEEEKKSSKIDDETLIKLAERLGISTEGKPREKLVEEIVEEAKRRGLLEESKQ